MTSSQMILALDVGEKRIGVALADTAIKIAITYDTISVDGDEDKALARIISLENIDRIVVGYPRNQSGEPTAQTAFVETFTERLQSFGLPIDYQDESLTSVKAEELLKSQKKPYQKADIDSLAASLILQDYLELQ
ncbi:MAG TPA: Holliday junction resolvase RuvX [Candidatus Saccharimonas sp.]|jgi:putative Holliday junction resolvase|nr:Holliday junction resolvase RuvX [Candidatus Saccharibacteria bacterium]HPQ82478.1 Holliday junction resolvase RuvX [Candidatus Saccharimonas sp.]